jgi:prevent-host-death family protein
MHSPSNRLEDSADPQTGKLTNQRTNSTVYRTGERMRAKKVVNLMEARASLSRLTQEVAKGGRPVAITQRSKLAAVLVNAEQYEADMQELEFYRRHKRQGDISSSQVMEILEDLNEGSQRLAEDYRAALKRSGDQLRDALRD